MKPPVSIRWGLLAQSARIWAESRIWGFESLTADVLDRCCQILDALDDLRDRRQSLEDHSSGYSLIALAIENDFLVTRWPGVVSPPPYKSPFKSVVDDLYDR
jgi:hypothetical protein